MEKEDRIVKTETTLKPGIAGVFVNVTVYNSDGTKSDYEHVGTDEIDAWKGMAVKLARLLPHGES